MKATTVSLVLAASLASASAWAGTAFWTGKQRQVQTVTYKFVWECEYNYNGQRFTRLFELSCPSSIEVQ